MDSSIGETVRREISKLVECHIDIVRNSNIHNEDFLGEKNDSNTCVIILKMNSLRRYVHAC